MPLEIVNRDLLDAAEGAILLTIDGTQSGMEGNLTRAFAQRFPETWEEVQHQAKLPIPLGAARVYQVIANGSCPFSHVILASTLHHLDVLDGKQKASLVGSALSQSIAITKNTGAEVLNSAVLTGGWRLDLESAVQIMTTTYDLLVSSGVSPPTLRVHIKSHEDYSRVLRFTALT